MPIDLRRCAEAAAHAALTEAFARPDPQPRRRTRPRLRPVRAVVLGAGLVTTARVALNPALRSELLQALARHFPIQELLDEIVLEADVVPDPDDGEQAVDDQDRAADDQDRAADDQDQAADDQDQAADDREQASGGQPDDAEEKPARSPNRRSAGGRSAPAKKPAATATQQRRRHTARARGDTNGQSKRKPPNRGTRA